MISTSSLVIGGLVLGIGTFAIRAAGPLLHSRVRVSVRVQALMSVAATVLLLSLCVTSTFADGDEWTDLARPAGVLVAGVLAWRRAPFVVIVLAAAGTTAGLRLLGV